MKVKASKAVTPIAFVRAIVRAYEHYGADPRHALQAGQITPSILGRAEGRITASQFESVCDVAMRELDDEALGWFTRRLPWGSYGMLCRASLTSPDLGVALKRWCRHHRLLTDDIVLSLRREGGLATISIEERRDLGPMREFCLVTSLRYLHGYACWAVDSRISVQEVTFPFEPPAHHTAYPHFFPGPVFFNSPAPGFSFAAQYLDLPVRRDERALRGMLKRALPLTVWPYRRDRLLAQRVRDLLRESPSEFGSAETLSAALHVSSRTLHRLLREEDTSLQQLKNDVRRTRAIEKLFRTKLSVKQVASAVGFRNEKSFSRAFKEWTGESPGAFRRKVVTAD